MARARSTRSPLIRRMFASVAAVAVTGAVVFTGVQGASASISTARGSAVSLTSIGALDASGIMAGGQVERVVAVMVPAGSRSVLSVSAETSSILDQDKKNGLQLRGELCSGRWIRVEERFTCSGVVTTALAPRPIVGVSALALGVQPVGGQLVRLTLSLPATASDNFMGQSSALSYRIA